MGLILPQTIKVRTSVMTYKHYKEKGYEFKKCGDFIEVNVLDLPKGSHEMVKIVCDICGKEREMWYRDVVKCNEENKLITCGSNFCRNKKYEDTCMEKYGVRNAAQSQEVKNKTKDTNLERYGCGNAMQNKEIQSKREDTNLERYGHKCPLQNKEIQNKSKDTCIKKYSVDHPSKAQEIKDKKKNTCQLHFKCDWPLQNTEIREKSIKTWQKKYGENITNPFQLESVKEKSKQTWQKNYGEGIINPGQVQEIKDRQRKTWQKNYGEDIINPFQVESIKEKSKQTMLNNYGVENPMQCKEIQDKAKATNLERHGVEYPTQNEEIKNKALDSFQFNHTGPCSRQQKYIHFLIGGALNKHVCNSLVDICFKEEKIAIEYDGRGHFLTDMFNGNKTPSKEALLREKERENKIINNGYKMIRFIAAKDRIPSDEVILNLIEGFKNSDFKVIRINFEEGTIDRDYEEKWYCNFGKLRKITQKDLEQFESKKTINLK